MNLSSGGCIIVCIILLNIFVAGHIAAATHWLSPNNDNNYPAPQTSCSKPTDECLSDTENSNLNLRLSCSFEEIDDNITTPGRLHLPVCGPPEDTPNGPDVWKSIPWYPYQFRYTEEASRGNFGVKSNCTRMTGVSSPGYIISPSAIATLRSSNYVDPYNGTCRRYNVSFWVRFSESPAFSDDHGDQTRFFLSLDLWRSTNSAYVLPQMRLWGRQQTDFDDIPVNQWRLITTSFTENNRFALVFFAHHKTNCTDPDNSGTIFVDEVITTTECVVPTTTTTSTNTTTKATTTTTKDITTTTEDTISTPENTTTTEETTTETPTPATTTTSEETTTETPTPANTTTSEETTTETPTPANTTTSEETTTETPTPANTTTSEETTTETPTPANTTTSEESTTETPTPANTTTSEESTTETHTPANTTTTEETTTETPTPANTTITEETTTATPTPANTTITEETTTATPTPANITITEETTTATPTPANTTITEETTTATPTPANTTTSEETTTATPTPANTTITEETTTATPTPANTTITEETTTATPTPANTTITEETTTATPTPANITITEETTTATPTPANTTITEETTTTTPTPANTTITEETTTATPTPANTTTSEETTTATPTPANTTITEETTTATPTPANTTITEETTTATPTPANTTITEETTTTTPTPANTTITEETTTETTTPENTTMTEETTTETTTRANTTTTEETTSGTTTTANATTTEETTTATPTPANTTITEETTTATPTPANTTITEETTTATPTPANTTITEETTTTTPTPANTTITEETTTETTTPENTTMTEETTTETTTRANTTTTEETTSGTTTTANATTTEETTTETITPANTNTTTAEATTSTTEDTTLTTEDMTRTEETTTETTTHANTTRTEDTTASTTTEFTTMLTASTSDPILTSTSSSWSTVSTTRLPLACPEGQLEDPAFPVCRCPFSHYFTGISDPNSQCAEYSIIVEAVLRMEGFRFHPSLEDPNSELYGEFNNSVVFATNLQLENANITGADVVIVEFRNGSVIADMLIRHRDAALVSNAQIQNAVRSTWDNITVGEVTSQVFPNDVRSYNRCVSEGVSYCVLNTSRCEFYSDIGKSVCVCLGGFVADPQNPYRCRDACDAHPCGANVERCAKNERALKQRDCVCKKGYTHWSNKDACHDELLPLYISLGIAVPLLLCWFGALFYMARRKKRMSNSPRPKSRGISFGGDPVSMVQLPDRYNDYAPNANVGRGSITSDFSSVSDRASSHNHTQETRLTKPFEERHHVQGDLRVRPNAPRTVPRHGLTDDFDTISVDTERQSYLDYDNS